jgi:serine/threonine protein kinase
MWGAFRSVGLCRSEALSDRTRRKRGLAIPNSIAQIGNFRLHRRLGRDHVFETWLAEVEQENLVPRPVLLKRLLTDVAADPNVLSLFSLRARKASRLLHPNILRVTDVVLKSSAFAIATELYDGKSLRELMLAIRAAGNALPVWFAVRVARFMASALEYAHKAVDEQGNSLYAAHHDISPSTVVVTFDGRVKLVDFGFSARALGLESSRPMAALPPNGSGNPWAESASEPAPLYAKDIRDVGTTLYELLTGETPGDDYVVPSRRATWVGRDVDDCVARLLCSDHPERITTASELGEVLDTRLADTKHEVTQSHVAGVLALLFSTEYRDSGPPTIRSSAGSVPRIKVPPVPPVPSVPPVPRAPNPFSDEEVGSSQPTKAMGVHLRDTLNPRPVAEEDSSERSARAFDRASERKLDVFRHDWDAALERVRREAPQSRASGSYRVASERRAEPPPPPKDPLVLAGELFDEGLVSMQKGELEAALAAWEQVLKLDPEHRVCRANINLLKKRMGKSL